MGSPWWEVVTYPQAECPGDLLVHLAPTHPCTPAQGWVLSSVQTPNYPPTKTEGQMHVGPQPHTLWVGRSFIFSWLRHHPAAAINQLEDLGKVLSSFPQEAATHVPPTTKSWATTRGPFCFISA